MSLSEFINLYHLKITIPTLRKAIKRNEDNLKNKKIIMITGGDIRKRYEILNGDKLLEVLS